MDETALRHRRRTVGDVYSLPPYVRVRRDWLTTSVPGVRLYLPVLPFVFLDQRPGEPAALTTTLRHRVIEQAAEHMREHLAQLADTLSRCARDSS